MAVPAGWWVCRVQPLLVAAALCSIAHGSLIVARSRRIAVTGPRLAPHPGTPSSELVTAIVPARDEAAVLDGCLTALRGQTYGRGAGSGALRVVVVDDASSDATAAIAARHAARDPRVRVLASTGPPPGWTGKVHALALGLAADGDRAQGWVLALDADVLLAPEALARLLATAVTHRLDLVSTPGGPPPNRSLTWPLLMPGALGLIGAYAAPDGRGRRALAIGHCLLVRRVALDAVGGWAALWNRRGEDIALATRIRDHGGRTRLLDGLEVATTTGMDPLAAGWASFRKSFVAATHAHPGALIAGGLLQILMATAAPLLLFTGRSRDPVTRPLVVPLALTAWSLQALAHAHTAALMRATPAFAPLTPLSGVAAGLLLLDGARTVLTGTNTWKHRRP